jgi:hypothetical protein
MLSHLLHQKKTLEGAEEINQKKLNGIVADLLVDFSRVAASASGGSDATSSLFGLVRTLCDAKTLACGDVYMPFIAAYPNDRETPPVEKRAAKCLNNTLLRHAISTRSPKNSKR